MKNCIIVCEFNPFHYGHEYLIKTVKEKGYNVVCLMSGNFTQRGEPGIISKYARAKSAILGGADLVIEYPYPYSSSNANIFTSEAIKIANMLGGIDAIAFGSETADKDYLINICQNMLSKEYKDALDKEKIRGTRYSEALKNVYTNLFGKCEVFDNSNDILNIGYISSIINNSLKFEIIPIQRIGNKYNDLSNEGILSATNIRKTTYDGKLNELENSMPKYSYNVLKDEESSGRIADYKKMLEYAIIKYRVNSNPNLTIYELNRELHSRLISNSSISNADNFIENVSNKVFSQSSVKRAVLNFCLDYNSEIYEPNYTNVLAFNEVGRKILREIKSKSSINIITKPSDYKIIDSYFDLELINLNIKLDRLYTSITQKPLEGDYFLKQTPYYSK